MAMLLGDVGGTNARLAIARNGVIDDNTVTRFRGDDFASFDDVVRRFQKDQDQPRITSVCIAVAGPVSGGKASLTNRDWDFDEHRLARLTDADHVRLINDLTALGYATPSLSGDGLAVLREAPEDRARNGQALVVGLGTGFNVCAPQRPKSPPAEVWFHDTGRGTREDNVAAGPPSEIVSRELVRELYGVDCTLVTDTDTGAPLLANVRRARDIAAPGSSIS